MLDRLVGRPVLAKPNRIVGPDVDHVEPGEGRQPHRSTHVVAEVEKRGDVWDEAAVIREAVGDAAHGVLADPEAKVPTRLVGTEIDLALDVSQVRFRQVGGATEQLRHRRGQQLNRVLAGVASRDLGANLVGLEARVPAIGEPGPGHAAEELGSSIRMGVPIALEARLPLLDQGLALGDRRAEMVTRLVRNVERAIRVPAVGLLGQADLLGSQRRAMCLLAVLLVRAPEADMRADGDQARSAVRAGALDRGFDRAQVVAILDPLGVPAIRLEACRHVL